MAYKNAAMPRMRMMTLVLRMLVASVRLKGDDTMSVTPTVLMMRLK